METISVSKAIDILAKVRIVKLCLPLNHLHTSGSVFPTILANCFCVSPLAFNSKSIFSETAKESSISLLTSSEISATLYSKYNTLVILVKFSIPSILQHKLSKFRLIVIFKMNRKQRCLFRLMLELQYYLLLHIFLYLVTQIYK